MILESIVITQNSNGVAHIAPMGLHQADDGLLLLPFKPSTTLNNIRDSGVATINYCDDVRVFAGCLTGRYVWPLKPALQIDGQYLQAALAHNEVKIIADQNDTLRPKLTCKVIYSGNHAPFKGFNRAQLAVIEATILISRLKMLPWSKIEAEIAYLKMGLDKTAGAREYEAWEWLMVAIADFKQQNVGLIRS